MGQSSKIIILRGNSGSGKSSVARMLQEQIIPHPLLIEHDHFRRKIIREKEKHDIINPELMMETIKVGLKHNRHIIIEGILPTSNYAKFFEDVVRLHPRQNYFFYFDLPFAETLKRHATKPNSHEFGKEEMKQWWKDHDFLPGTNEKIISASNSLEETVTQIREIAGV